MPTNSSPIPLFGSRLREQRIRAKLEQAELGERLAEKIPARKKSLTQGVVSRWELGKGLPRFEVMPALCEVLGCSADYLLGREDVPFGLTPGKIIIDLDKVENPVKVADDDWGWQIPARFQIVSYERALEIGRAQKRKGKGK